MLGPIEKIASDENFTITMTIAEHEKKKIKCPKCKGTKVVPQFPVVLGKDLSKKLAALPLFRGSLPLR